MNVKSIRKTPSSNLFFIASVLVVLINAFFVLISHLSGLGYAQENSLMQQQLYVVFFKVVFIAPIVETLLFQFTIIELGAYAFGKLPMRVGGIYTIPVLSSSLAFSLSHPFSVLYVICTFLIGLILAVSYVQISKREGMSIACMFCIGVHMISNAFSFFMNLL